VFPRFSNNDDELCPLSYSMSPSNLIYSPYEGLEPLEVSDDEEELSVTVPFTDADRLKNVTWKFYLHAINRDNAQEFSHEIVIKKEPLCITKVGPVNIDPVLFRNDSSKIKTRTYKEIHWAEDYVGAEIPYIKVPVSKLYKQWGGETATFQITANDCPLLSPYYYVAH
jgi:hypothetical protein